MNTFKLSAAVNADKVFLTARSQLEGRIDPHQYHPQRRSLIAALNKANKVVPLSKIVINAKQVTTKITGDDVYIGLENIISDTGEYLATSEKQSISSAGVFKKGQILFPKLRPYLNKVYLAEFEGLCSTEFHIFETKCMNAEFLAIYLRSSLVVNQTRHLMTGNTLPRLQTEDINRLPVPLIANEVQLKVVSLYNEANYKRQQKNQQAAALLASIDGYLLGELGITLPEQDNSLEKRMFYVNSREVMGLALSPVSYARKIRSEYKSTYEFFTLDEIACMYQPKTITQQDMMIDGEFKVYGANGLIGFYDKYNHECSEILVTCRGATCGEVNLSEPKSWVTGNAMVVHIQVDFVRQSYLGL
jgi:type I restriction enzyme, S subunit